MKKNTLCDMQLKQIVVVLATLFSVPAFANTVTDDFTQAVDTNNWKALNYACLTAGTSTNNTTGNSNIKGCNYTTPDVAGSGALRLTPADGGQTGAIISNFTFPSNQGLQVTFTTYTYGGNSGGLAKDGADGIGFFLTDGGTTANPIPAPAVAGGSGGSLGYSCSNINSVYDGLENGYIGLGMDEYGNFLNAGDNTNTGILNSNAAGGTTTNGSNSFYDSSQNYFQPNRIGLRGAGNVNWNWLNKNYPDTFPTGSTNQKTLVTDVCKTGGFANETTTTKPLMFPAGTDVSTYGKLTAYSSKYYPVPYSPRKGYTIPSATAQTNAVNLAQSTGQVYDFSTTPDNPTPVSTTNTTTNTVTVPNYAVIPGGYRVLPETQLIASETAKVRADAWPITYKLIITSTNLLTLMYSYNGGTYQPVLTNQSLTASNGTIPSSFRFGFSGATGGSTNIHEITCFVAQPVQSSSSAAANTVQAGQVQTGTQIYLAGYNPNNWAGTLGSYNLVNTSGVVTASTIANWDGSCVLTGGGCSAMGTDANNVPLKTVTVESPATRQLLSWSGTAGIPLQWSSLTPAQQSLLNATDNNGQNRLAWLRGDRSQEQSASPAGPLRTRDSVLGDIIDSSPTWVGGPVLNYASPFSDALYGSTGAPENATTAQTYSSYTSSYATRTNMVFSGSNDGLLHGFRSGSYNADGSYNNTDNDGKELIGFMPATVLANSNVVGLTSPTYGHNYFVNASPGIGDLFYNNTWHTWLVGGLGEGGAEIYALDITDPANFSETNASSLVKGDWTDASLSNLGKTYGTPIIRRLHNGQWAIIFGNGFGSSKYHAGVYIGLVDSTTGAVTYKWLDTGVGTSASPDGIAYVSSADLDGDRVTDYLYAGDILGNVWRFDLTSSNVADWGVSKFGKTTPTPLFVSGSGQPITSSMTVASTTTNGSQRLIIMFGTGKKTPATTTSPDTYVTGKQTVYGIWDYNMHNWNNGVTTTNSVAIPASTIKYAELTAPQTIVRSVLLPQSVATTATGTTGSAVLGYRSVSSTNQVCWAGSSGCTTNGQFGWYFDLPDTNEQVIYNPVLVSGALVVNTTIPPVNTVGQCSLLTPTGWSMAFDVASGGGLPQGFFQDATGSFAPASNNSTVMGIKINGVGSVGIITIGNSTYAYTQTVTGQPQVNLANPQNGIKVKRISWEELR